MQIVPESHRDLVSDSSKAIAYLATTLSSGAPIIAPVWFGVLDDKIAVFTGLSALKTRNMQAQPEVALVMQDPDDVYRYLQIRGRYVGYTEEDARAWLDETSRRYIGKDYPHDASEDGVLLLIEPTRVNVFGWSGE